MIWNVKPTNELDQSERKLLYPIDERSAFYIWLTDHHEVLASATLINLDVGLILDLSETQGTPYQKEMLYRVFGIISRIVNPKPTVILNPDPHDVELYHQLGFVKKGNTYTKTIEL